MPVRYKLQQVCQWSPELLVRRYHSNYLSSLFSSVSELLFRLPLLLFSYIPWDFREMTLDTIRWLARDGVLVVD